MSLNRLAGIDDPAKRDALLEELLRDVPTLDLDQLTSTADREIARLLQALGPDYGEHGQEAVVKVPPALRRITFMVSPPEAEAIERAIAERLRGRSLRGARRRGRALALLCGLEEQSDD